MSDRNISLHKYESIFFDLDGTLSDSSTGIIKGFHHAFSEMGIHDTNGFDFTKVIGSTLHESFRDYFSFDENQVESAVKFFRTYYAEQGWKENRLYDGVKTMLRKLSEQSFKLFVVTNKPEVYAQKILEHFGIESFFRSISGVLLENNTLTKKQLLLHIISSSDIGNKENCILVGDTKYDLDAANHFELDAIAVTYGFGKREDLVGYRPTFIADSVAEVEKILCEE